MSAARAADVSRFVAQSFTGWTNERTGSLIKTEDDPFDPNPLPEQLESLDAIRFLERSVTEAPLVGIALRYANFYGPGGSEELADLIRKRKFPIVGDGKGVWSWIHLEDAASATVAAIERGQRGIYNIADDDPAPVEEWLPFLAGVVGETGTRVVPQMGELEGGVSILADGNGRRDEAAEHPAMKGDPGTDDVAALRPLLFSIAYRMLASAHNSGAAREARFRVPAKHRWGRRRRRTFEEGLGAFRDSSTFRCLVCRRWAVGRVLRFRT